MRWVLPVLMIAAVRGEDDAVSKMFAPERQQQQLFMNKIGEKMDPRKEPDLICRSAVATRPVRKAGVE